MIEGMVQGLIYGSSAAILYHRMIRDGVDVTSPDSAPKITLYNPSGTELSAETAMTQVGSTAVYKKSTDISATASWGLAFNYHAKVELVKDSVTTYPRFQFDVVKWPYNEPILSSEEIDGYHPTWSGKRPAGWTNWVPAMELAIVQLQNDLRGLRDDKGEPVYPNRVMNRTALRLAELAYIERVISGEIRMSEMERTEILERAAHAIDTVYYIDRDDDLTIDSDEEAAIGITRVR